MRLQDYAHLWDGTEPGWVLWYVKAAEDSGDVRNWSVFNVQSKMALVIEDDALFQEVVGELHRRGVEVVTEYPG